MELRINRVRIKHSRPVIQKKETTNTLRYTERPPACFCNHVLPEIILVSFVIVNSRMVQMVGAHTVSHLVLGLSPTLYKYMDQKGSLAMLATKRSAGVASEVNLRNPLHANKEAHKWGTSGQTSPEAQNRGISGPTKRTLCPPNIFKKVYAG